MSLVDPTLLIAFHSIIVNCLLFFMLLLLLVSHMHVQYRVELTLNPWTYPWEKERKRSARRVNMKMQVLLRLNKQKTCNCMFSARWKICICWFSTYRSSGKLIFAGFPLSQQRKTFICGFPHRSIGLSSFLFFFIPFVRALGLVTGWVRGLRVESTIMNEHTYMIYK